MYRFSQRVHRPAMRPDTIEGQDSDRVVFEKNHRLWVASCRVADKASGRMNLSDDFTVYKVSQTNRATSSHRNTDATDSSRSTESTFTLINKLFKILVVGVAHHIHLQTRVERSAIRPLSCRPHFLFTSCSIEPQSLTTNPFMFVAVLQYFSACVLIGRTRYTAYVIERAHLRQRSCIYSRFVWRKICIPGVSVATPRYIHNRGRPQMPHITPHNASDMRLSL